MALQGGYWGKAFSVDLTTGEVSLTLFDEAYARKYLGGVGFAVKIISDLVTKETDPLKSENVLVFATGPYQAANIAGAARCSAAAKSPLTGYWGESSCGGHFGTELKRAGIDTLTITGKAKTPVYLWINNGKIEIRDARNLWGKDTVETVDEIRSEVGETRASVAVIGPAGEKLVRYACILNDKHAAFGRCGLGAVMGSKNLKAVAVRGDLKPPIADPDKLSQVYKDVLNKIKNAPFTEVNSRDGQVASIVPREAAGLLPVKNFKQDNWRNGAEKIGTPTFTETLKAGRWACAYCVMGCHRKITNTEYESQTAGPEYETEAMIGSNLLIDDLHSIVKANDLCNRYGLDTIELGAVLGWAFECYENGLITKKDTGGVDLTWGNGAALVIMVEKIAKRIGIGNLLAEGLRPCVDKYPASKPYAIEVMGQGVAGHDPRAYFGEVISTIASTRGSCHMHGFAEAAELGVLLPELGITKTIYRFEWKEKGYVGAIYQDIQQFWNSLGWCFFYFFSDVSLTYQISLLNAITGWDVTPKEAQSMGERIVCMQHIFNLKMGLQPLKDNVMPERLTIPHVAGGAVGEVPPWQDILKEYWETKDWPNGVPSNKKLVELGIE